MSEAEIAFIWELFRIDFLNIGKYFMEKVSSVLFSQEEHNFSEFIEIQVGENALKNEILVE